MKNKNRIANVFAGLVIGFGILAGCANNSSRSIDSIVIDMRNDKVPDNQKPFELRNIDANLKGKWLGHAVSYGCYRKGQAPGVTGPTKAQILEDLKIVSEYWNLIRVYGSDSDAENVLEVIKENNLPVKVMLGVWLENEAKNPDHREANIKQVVKSIELGNRYREQLFAINVGNEAQVFWSWHKMAMKNLIKYVRYVRNNTEIPVTVADDYNFWNKPESKKVASEVDFIVCHAYPLWNGKTLAESIPWLNEVLSDVQNMHEEKKIVLGEIGWATIYNAEKKGPGEQGSLIIGEVSDSAQEKFLRMLHNWTQENKIITFWFEAFDESWKGGGEHSGPNEIEKNWGVFYEDRTPKESFVKFLNSLNSEHDRRK